MSFVLVPTATSKAANDPILVETSTGCTGNYILNPGFESGSTEWTLNGNASITTSVADVGSRALQLNNSGDNAFQRFDFNAGESFNLTFRARNNASAGISGGGYPV